MDISYARWMLGAEPAQLLLGSVREPASYGALGTAYGDPAGGGPIELKRLDAATATSSWVTFDQSLKIAPFAVSPERFVAGIDGAAAARSYAWSIDRFLPLHDLAADPLASGLYDPTPTDGWPSEPEGAASAETFLVRGIAEYAAFQVTLGGTFAWAGLPGEIWLGSVVSGAPWPISDADRWTARNEPEPVVSTDRRRAHVVYSSWDVDDSPFECQQIRVVTVDFSCATLDLLPIADRTVGAAAPGASGSAPEVRAHVHSSWPDAPLSVRVAAGQDGVHMEDLCFTVWGGEDAPAADSDPDIALELPGERTKPGVHERSFFVLDLVQSLLDPPPSGGVELQVLLLGGGLDLNPPAHRATFLEHSNGPLPCRQR
jgi:hypothetical protein